MQAENIHMEQSISAQEESKVVSYDDALKEIFDQGPCNRREMKA